MGLAKYIKENERFIVLEGISTHYANIEDTLDSSYAKFQLERFNKAANMLKKKNNKLLAHTACSAAVLLYKSTHLDMIRVGIGLYGLWPSKETQIALSLKKGNKIILRPVLSWKSRIAQVKTIDAGEPVGYGLTWYAPRRSKIGIIPQGYYDGYDRKLSNNSKVIVSGSEAPVIGRVAMNMIIVDLTNVAGAKTSDEVVLIGKYKGHEVSADYLSERIGTINYEVVTRINPNISRIII